MERNDESAVLIPEPSYCFTSAQKAVPQNVDTSNRTVYRTAPTTQSSGTLVSPLNAGGSRTTFAVSCPGNGKIDLAHTCLELSLQFWDGNAGVPGALQNAVPIADITGALIQNITFSINGQSNPVWTSIPDRYLLQRQSYLYMTYSEPALQQLPWLFTPVFSENYAINDTAGGQLPDDAKYATYLQRGQRWFDMTVIAHTLLAQQFTKIHHLTIPLRDLLCSRIGGDSAPLNLREFVLDIVWSPSVNTKGFVRFTGNDGNVPPVLEPPLCAVSVVGASMMVSTYVVSASELISGTKDKVAGKDDILPFYDPKPQDLAAGLTAFYPSVSNLDHVLIVQEAWGRTNGGTESYSDSEQWLIPNCYRAFGGHLIERYDSYLAATLTGTIWGGCSMTYGSIAAFPSQSLILSDGGYPMFDQAKYFYDMAVDRISRRDLIPAISLANMSKTRPFICLRPWSSEGGVSLTRIAKDVVLRWSSFGSGYAGENSQYTMIVSRLQIYSIGTDGSVRKME